MTTAATITAELLLNAIGFKKGISTAIKSTDDFQNKMVRVGDSLGKLGGAMTKIGGAMTVGLTLPIVAFGVSSVQSAMDAENALADLNAVLTSTGNIAGVTLDELTKNASALQKVTKFSDEAVMSAQGMLLTFTNIGKDIFPAATEATLDMAQKFGMDASQAAITLGKALNDPIAGVTALRRIGVMLTDEQEKQIKQFMEVGDIASAQAIIMKELAVEIGGVAEAAGATNSGKLEQFKNQLDDMKETVGAALIPILLRLMEVVVPLIEKFANASPGMQKFILVLVGLIAAAGPVIAIVGSLITAIGAIAPVVGTVVAALGTIAGVISGAIVPILIIIGVIGALVAVVALVYLAFKNNFMGITTFVKKMWSSVKPVFEKITKGLELLFPKQAKILKGFVSFFKGIKSGLKTLYEDGSGLLLDLAMSFGIPEKAAQNFLTTVYDVAKKFKDAWGKITGGGANIKAVAESGVAMTRSVGAAGAAVQTVAAMSEDALKMMTSRNQTFVSTLETYSSFQQGYEADHKSAVDAVTEAQDKLNEATKNFGPASQAVKDATQNLEDQRTKLGELEASWFHATQKMVADLVMAQFMADGILTDAETKAYVAFGVQAGLFTEAQAMQTQVLLDQASAYVAGVQQGEEYINEQRKILGSVEANISAAGRLASALGSASGGIALRGSGGIQIPATSYGTGSGQTVNVTVNNPKVETFEETIRKNLQALSFTGVLKK